MSFFSQLFELLGSIFHGGGPEAKQKQDLRKIETEVRNIQPAIYKAAKVIPFTSGCSRIRSISFLEQVTTFTTPSGRPASL